MKHNIQIIAWLTLFFLIAQFIGIAALYQYIDPAASSKSGKTVFRDMELAGTVLERPQVEESSSFAYIMVAVLIGTAIMMLLMKFQVTWLWKVWFLLAVVICVGLGLSAFIPSWLALIIAILVAIIKIVRPNFWVQNLSELFMYSGLAIIFVPIMNLTGAIALLVLISIYDAYAVWRSKHMISLAKFQASQQMFAGLVMPYEGGKLKTHLPTQIAKSQKSAAKESRSPSSTKSKTSMNKGPGTAILGGGDIGFPLIFAGVVMKSWGLTPSLVIPIFAAIALVILFIKGNDGKFYPAMPFISAGCFIGLAVAALI